eukprot:COSAG02_NODE_16997_length_1037_cov_0.987207_2_plen_45_part_01
MHRQSQTRSVAPKSQNAQTKPIRDDHNVILVCTPDVTRLLLLARR